MSWRRERRGRLRGWWVAVLGVASLGLALAAFVRVHRAAAPAVVTMSAGGRNARSLRHQLFLALEREAAAKRVLIRQVETRDWSDMVTRINAGTLDFALVQGGFDLTPFPNLRQVTALDVEPLHLLVKEEIYPQVAERLSTLRGKVINLASGSTMGTYQLSQEVLAFAGLKLGAQGKPGDYTATHLRNPQIAAMKDRARLPDAVFIVSAMPSPIVHDLVTKQRYRLVALPFADAFGLGALTPGEVRGTGPAVRKESLLDVVLPSFTYQMDPPVPPQPIHTLGARTLLLTHKRTDPEVVVRILDAVYTTRFAKLLHPPITPELLQQPPEVPWHPGTQRYLWKDQPLITGENVGELASVVTIGAPLAGAFLCLWQWFQQRGRPRREAVWEPYLRQVTAIEREAAALENAANLDPGRLHRLRHELGHIKAEALDGFVSGRLDGAELLASFLAHVNDARTHLARLAVPGHDGPGPRGLPAVAASPGSDRTDAPGAP